MSVRRAAIEDADRVAAVHVASWRAAYPGLLPDDLLAGLSVERRAANWRSWLAAGGERTFTLLAEVDGEVAAFCTVAMPTRDEGEAGDVAEIPALYADPTFFATGVGTALIDAAVEEMRERDYREGILWMLEGNDRAAGFYERRGWHRDGGKRPSQYFPGLVGPAEVRWRRRL